jgi:integrase
MPSIYRRTEKGRKRNSWVISYKDAGGQWKKRYAKSKEEAENLRSELVRQSMQAVPPNETPNITVKDYSEKWLERRRTGGFAAKTVRSDEWALEKHIRPVFGAMRVRAIHRAQVKELLARKRAEGLAKDTVRLIRATLSSLLADAIDDGIVLTNAAQGIRLRKVGHVVSPAERLKRIRPMTYEQLDAFLAAARGQCPPRDWAFFLAMADTGLRPGEAVGVKWDDFNPSRRELHIQRAITEDGEEKLTKTETTRTVDVSERLAEVLRRRRQEEERRAAKRNRKMSPWMFASDRGGGPLSPGVMSHLFREVVVAAGLSHFTLYDLRHTFATHLLMERADLLYVAYQLGHAKPTTTLQYYAHWMPRGDKAHLDRMIVARQRIIRKKKMIRPASSLRSRALRATSEATAEICVAPA